MAYVTLTSVSPLSAAIPSGTDPHTFDLEWAYNTTASAGYTELRVYRYIGRLGDCGLPDAYEAATNPQTKLIRTISSNVENRTTYTDPLGSYYSESSVQLRNEHHLQLDAANDKEILDGIYAQRRAIFYTIIGKYKSGGYDSLPWVVIVDSATGVVRGVSSRTQVKYNKLVYEGDLFWETQLYIPGVLDPVRRASAISRTSVDVVGFNSDPDDEDARTNPTCWVTQRELGWVYRLNMESGGVHSTYFCGGQYDPGHIRTEAWAPSADWYGERYGTKVNSQGHGFGASVDPYSGDLNCCTVGPYRWPGRDGPGTTTDTMKDDVGIYAVRNAKVSGELETAWNPYAIQICPYSTPPVSVTYPNSARVLSNPAKPFAAGCYGMTARIGDPGGIFFIQWSSAPLKATRKSTVYYLEPSPTPGEEDRKYATRILLGGVDEQWGDGDAPDTVVGKISFPYGVASSAISRNPWPHQNTDRDYDDIGTIFITGHADNRLYYVYPHNPAGGFDTTVGYVQAVGSTYLGTHGGGDMYQPLVSGRYIGQRGVTCTNPRLYPNRFGYGGVYTENDGTVGTYFRTFTVGTYIDGLHEHQWSLTAPPDTPSLSKVSDHDLGEGFHPTGVGVDGENNLWVAGNKVAKIYNQVENDEYPYGTECRYPTVGLDDFAEYTRTNKKDIEWFLTRDPGAMTLPAARATWWFLVTNSHTERRSTWGFTYGYGRHIKQTINSDGSFNQFTYQSTVTANIRSFYHDFSAWPDSFTGQKLYPMWFDAVSEGGPGVREITRSDIDNIRRVDPFWENYHNPGIPRFSPTIGSNAYCYSDFTGNVIYGIENIQPTAPSTDRPAASFPGFTIGLVRASQSSPLDGLAIDGEYGDWKNTSISGSRVEGFDDLTVTVSANINTDVGFGIQRWEFDFGDYPYDWDGSTNVPVVRSNSVHGTYTYHDPSRFGLSAVRFNSTRNATGHFLISARAIAEGGNDVYTCAPANYPGLNSLTAVVFERWPSALFFHLPLDASDLRNPWLGCNLSWKRPPYDGSGGMTQPVEVSTTNVPRNNRVIGGTDPLSATFHDYSIARTFPISSWTLTVSADPTEDWHTVQTWTSTTITTSELYAPQDSYQLRFNAFQPLSFRYGTYYVTLVANASNSETGSPNTYTQIVSVTDFEPFANFFALSALTVPSNYTDETHPRTSYLTSVPATEVYPVADYLGAVPAYISSDQTFISGYAPNLTIWFQDTSEPHTWPIARYDWEFGDYFDVANNTWSVEVSSVTGIFDVGCWKTDQTNHIVYHAYLMPGIYQVTLCAQASTTLTQDCCAKYLDNDKIYIYVEEIPPQCGFDFSASPVSGFQPAVLGGDSPLTVYFRSISAIPGSFPIARIDWDFGDGTPWVTQTRTPSTVYVQDGTSTVYLSDMYIGEFPLDYADPRNYLIPHTYTTYISSVATSFTVSMSVFAANTNTLGGPCVADQIIGPVFPLPPAETPSEDRHLIGSRIVGDDLLLVFEGESTRTIYDVMLSGGAT